MFYSCNLGLCNEKIAFFSETAFIQTTNKSQKKREFQHVKNTNIFEEIEKLSPTFSLCHKQIYRKFFFRLIYCFSLSFPYLRFIITLSRNLTFLKYMIISSEYVMLFFFSFVILAYKTNICLHMLLFCNKQRQEAFVNGKDI